MKGLIVKSTTWNGETCKIGMPDGGVGIAVNAMERDKYCFWSIGGYNLKEERHWIWKGGELHVGDKIEIEFAEFDEATPEVQGGQGTGTGHIRKVKIWPGVVAHAYNPSTLGSGGRWIT